MAKHERFFGLHFDYHANENTKDIGKNFDEKILEKIIKDVKPDFIQCDTKGHPGLTSYCTKVGFTAPGMVSDLLKKWRDVTKKYNIPLYSHYSGIWDKKATAVHPEWAEVHEDGTLLDRVSVFSKYEDELMIPQLKELINDYQIDGAWVDGDCWALFVDYSKNAIDAYKAKYHVNPPRRGDANFRQYLEFNRQGFFDYVKKYIDAAHKLNKDFMITSNWMNTGWIPDNINISDYISGDLSPTNSVDSARYGGRMMAMFERNWDLMSWGISFPVHHSKSAIQLIQEAACSLSIGGGFQIYNMEDPTNVVVEPKAIDTWAEVSKFVHDRKQYCYGGEFVPDLGLLYSVSSYYESLETIFNRDCPFNEEFNGTMLALLDQAVSVNVISEEKLTPEILKKYPRFALANTLTLPNSIINMLLEYAKNGGLLILLGTDTAKLFSSYLNFDIELHKDSHPIYFIDGNRSSLELRDSFALIKNKEFKTIIPLYKGVVEGDLSCTNPPPTILKDNKEYPGLAKIKYGNGEILVSPMNLGRLYLNERTVEEEDFFNKLVVATNRTLISHNHLGDLDVIYRIKDGKNYLHLINLLGSHRVPTISSFKSIPSLVNVDIKLKSKVEPTSIYSRPDNKTINYQYDKNKNEISIHLDLLELYEILEINF